MFTASSPQLPDLRLRLNRSRHRQSCANEPTYREASRSHRTSNDINQALAVIRIRELTSKSWSGAAEKVACRKLIASADQFSGVTFRSSLVSSIICNNTTNNCQSPPPLQIRVADSISIQIGPNTSYLEFGDLRSSYDASGVFSAQSSSLFSISLQLLLHNQPQIPSQSMALIEILYLSYSRSTELPHGNCGYSPTSKSIQDFCESMFTRTTLPPSPCSASSPSHSLYMSSTSRRKSSYCCLICLRALQRRVSRVQSRSRNPYRVDFMGGPANSTFRRWAGGLSSIYLYNMT
ncbi:hypothetical protein BKA64DRAFT_230225 [Cadophora sp. MPI-SDFR-AT-0126]|nr:hypothetical protein BKA64DRAFT_230225 [Leotiomycetes sp. MPI-SDFR-AT-0126]